MKSPASRKQKQNVRLSLEVIKRLPRSSKTYRDFIWDLEIPGFGAWRTPQGQVIFVYQYRMPHGPARRMTIGRIGEMTPAQAREVARELAYKRRRGIDPLEEKEAARTEIDAAKRLEFSAYVEDYIQRRIIESRPLIKQHERIVRNDIGELLAGKRIDKLTTNDIDDFLKDLGNRSKSARTWGLLYLKMLLNDAKGRGKIANSPADSYSLPPIVERDRILRADEVQRVMEAACDIGGVQGVAIEMLIRLCRRTEEVAGLMWEEIDQKTWTWNLPARRSKNKKPQTLNLPQQAVKILCQREPDPRMRIGPVFYFAGKRARSTMKLSSQVKDRLDANIHHRLELLAGDWAPMGRFEHFVFHDFRTTIATTLQRKPFRVATDVIEAVLWHTKNKRKASKYPRENFVEAAGEALQLWNDHLDSLMSSPDAWPGGREVEQVPFREIPVRLQEFRRGWPVRERKGGGMVDPKWRHDAVSLQ